MAHLAPLQLLLTTSIISIQLGVVQPEDVTSLALSCPSDQFACADGSKCIPKSKLCNGYGDCDNLGDELVSECDNCADSSKFTCRARGQMVCLSKDRYQCNGIYETCDDGSDEDPSVCDNCNRPDRAMCRDGSKCFKTKYACNGHAENCADGSDESDTWSNCTHCTKKGWVPCPGFPDICAKLCDGKATCPDKWDELLSTCNSQAITSVARTTTSKVLSNEAQTAICSKEDVLHQCEDSSM